MSHAFEHRHGNYTISDDPARIDVDTVYLYLRRAYWSENIPREVVERAIRGSLCIGAYAASGEQVGFVRLISDCATFCYLCDVYVIEEHRKRGLSKAMIALAMRHPKLQGLRRWNLVTQDAHGLYAKFGFTPVRHSERYMEKLDPSVYKRAIEETDE